MINSGVSPKGANTGQNLPGTRLNPKTRLKASKTNPKKAPLHNNSTSHSERALKARKASTRTPLTLAKSADELLAAVKSTKKMSLSIRLNYASRIERLDGAKAKAIEAYLYISELPKTPYSVKIKIAESLRYLGEDEKAIDVHLSTLKDASASPAQKKKALETALSLNTQDAYSKALNICKSFEDTDQAKESAKIYHWIGKYSRLSYEIVNDVIDKLSSLNSKDEAVDILFMLTKQKKTFIFRNNDKFFKDLLSIASEYASSEESEDLKKAAKIYIHITGCERASAAKKVLCFKKLSELGKFKALARACTQAKDVPGKDILEIAGNLIDAKQEAHAISIYSSIGLNSKICIRERIQAAEKLLELDHIDEMFLIHKNIALKSKYYNDFRAALDSLSEAAEKLLERENKQAGARLLLKMLRLNLSQYSEEVYRSYNSFYTFLYQHNQQLMDRLFSIPTSLLRAGKKEKAMLAYLFILQSEELRDAYLLCDFFERKVVGALNLFAQENTEFHAEAVPKLKIKKPSAFTNYLKLNSFAWSGNYEGCLRPALLLLNSQKKVNKGREDIDSLIYIVSKKKDINSFFVDLAKVLADQNPKDAAHVYSVIAESHHSSREIRSLVTQKLLGINEYDTIIELYNENLYSVIRLYDELVKEKRYKESVQLLLRLLSRFFCLSPDVIIEKLLAIPRKILSEGKKNEAITIYLLIIKSKELKSYYTGKTYHHKKSKTEAINVLERFIAEHTEIHTEAMTRLNPESTHSFIVYLFFLRSAWIGDYKSILESTPRLLNSSKTSSAERKRIELLIQIVEKKEDADAFLNAFQKVLSRRKPEDAVNAYLAIGRSPSTGSKLKSLVTQKLLAMRKYDELIVMHKKNNDFSPIIEIADDLLKKESAQDGARLLLALLGKTPSSQNLKIIEKLFAIPREILRTGEKERAIRAYLFIIQSNELNNYYNKSQETKVEILKILESFISQHKDVHTEAMARLNPKSTRPFIVYLFFLGSAWSGDYKSLLESTLPLLNSPETSSVARKRIDLLIQIVEKKEDADAFLNAFQKVLSRKKPEDAANAYLVIGTSSSSGSKLKSLITQKLLAMRKYDELIAMYNKSNNSFPLIEIADDLLKKENAQDGARLLLALLGKTPSSQNLKIIEKLFAIPREILGAGKKDKAIRAYLFIIQSDELNNYYNKSQENKTQILKILESFISQHKDVHTEAMARFKTESTHPLMRRLSFLAPAWQGDYETPRKVIRELAANSKTSRNVPEKIELLMGVAEANEDHDQLEELNTAYNKITRTIQRVDEYKTHQLLFSEAMKHALKAQRESSDDLVIHLLKYALDSVSTQWVDSWVKRIFRNLNEDSWNTFERRIVDTIIFVDNTSQFNANTTVDQLISRLFDSKDGKSNSKWMMARIATLSMHMYEIRIGKKQMSELTPEAQKHLRALVHFIEAGSRSCKAGATLYFDKAEIEGNIYKHRKDPKMLMSIELALVKRNFLEQNMSVKQNYGVTIEDKLKCIKCMKDFMALGSYLGNMDYDVSEYVHSILPFNELVKKMLSVTIDEIAENLLFIRTQRALLSSLQKKKLQEHLKTVHASKNKEELKNALSDFAEVNDKMLDDVFEIIISKPLEHAYDDDKDELELTASELTELVSAAIARNMSSLSEVKEDLERHGYLIEKDKVRLKLPKCMNPDAEVEVHL